MYNIYFTSDLHIGHNKEFLYQPRGFSSIQDHDAALVDNWNSLIHDNDHVYILGDLMLHDQAYGLQVLNQLQGKKYFIRGNHDTDVKCELYDQTTDLIPMSNTFSQSFAAIITIGKQRLYLSHFPTITTYKEELQIKKLSSILLSLSGHTHFKTIWQTDSFSYNIALDAHNMTPVAFEEIITDFKNLTLN